MALLGVKKDGQKMATPHLKSIVEDGVAEMIAAGADNPDGDWKASPEIHKCGPCNGSGFDYADGVPCIGCDGSGIDYELHYGMEGGKAYAYVRQYGLDAIREYCKNCREAEVDKVRANSALLRAFVLPAYARVDMIAEGIPVDEMMHDGELLRELTNMVAARYPEFMTTNLKRF